MKLKKEGFLKGIAQAITKSVFSMWLLRGDEYESREAVLAFGQGI